MLNFAVGPVMMDKSILKIGAKQIPYFRTPEFSGMMLENETMLKDCIFAPIDSRVVFLTGSGTLAMEATVQNLFNKEDKLLVINGGSFGDRFKQICDIHCIPYDQIELNPFSELTSDHLAKYDGLKYTGLLINVHETSTGVLYDMNLVSDFCKRNKMFLVVDAISSFLADPFDMEKLGANAVIVSSQKALALPPGISMVILDVKAQQRVDINETKSLYSDFKSYLLNGERGQTPFTPAVSILEQLNKRLFSILFLGVDKIIQDTYDNATDFRVKIKKLPFKIPVKSLSNALTPLSPIGKISADEICKHLREQKDIYVAPNGGILSEILFRVGHIGNLKTSDNTILINSLSQILSE